MKSKMKAAALAVALALGPTPAALAACPTEGATPFQAGPVHPVNGFATYLQDSEGLALELCLAGDGAGICFFDPANPANPFSVAVGFGPEAFWWLAESAFATNQVDVTLVMAAEAAWVAEEPISGDQFPFTRLRVRLDLPSAGIYSMVHPYGTSTWQVNAGGNGAVNETIDIPFAPNAQGQGRVGPWLKSVGAPFSFTDPVTSVTTTHIGDGTPRQATGSPCGNNFVQLTATALDGVTPLVLDSGNADGDGNPLTARSDLFVIHGQVYGGAVNTPLGASGANYSQAADGQPRVNVFAQAPTDAIVTSSLGGNVASDGKGRYFTSQLAAARPASVDITANAAADPLRTNNGPSTVSVPVTDLVTVTRAEAACSGAPRVCTLTIEAASSDAANPPLLTATGFGNLTGGALSVPGLSVVPAQVTVTSTAGGSDSEPVKVINLP